MKKQFTRRMKSILAGAMAFSLAAGLAACSSVTVENNSTQSSDSVQSSDSEQESEVPQSSVETQPGDSDIQSDQHMGGNGGAGMDLDKSADTELQEMISSYSGDFTVESYTDEETGLTVPYDLYLPSDYDASKQYPLVVFIGDMTTVGTDMERSLTQGWGGIVWADPTKVSEECIIAIPVYPETILDDHGAYTTTDYLTLTPRMIQNIAETHAVDQDRIYGTGQSMGAMTTLYTAAQNPDLYAGVLIVDGQWDITQLKGLESQNVMYLAAGGDESASKGQEEVKQMLTDDGIVYSEVSDVDAQDSEKEINNIVDKMISEGNSINFLTWTSGSVRKGISSNIESEHMASFDYGYKFSSIRDWLLNQRKQ